MSWAARDQVNPVGITIPIPILMILAIHCNCCRHHHLTILMTIWERAERDGQDIMNTMDTMDTMDTTARAEKEAKGERNIGCIQLVSVPSAVW